MGKIGAFMKVVAGRGARARSAQSDRRHARVRRHAAAHRAARAGGALHGVRRAVLSQRLPAREPDPGLERPRLSRQLARGDRAAAPHEQLPRVHRAPLPGAVRGGVCARDPGGRRGLDQAGRARDRRPRVGRGLDRPAAGRAARRAGASRSSAPARPGSRARSSWRAPASTSSSTSATRRPAGSSASACRSSRSRSGSSSAACEQLVAEGVEFRFGVDVARRRLDELRTSTMRSCLRSAPVCRVTCRCPGRELPGVHFAMEYLYERHGDPARRRRRSARPASTCRDRGRRHRCRLRRPRASRGRRVGDADRAARRAAALASRRPDAVAPGR